MLNTLRVPADYTPPPVTATAVQTVAMQWQPADPPRPESFDLICLVVLLLASVCLGAGLGYFVGRRKNNN